MKATELKHTIDEDLAKCSDAKCIELAEIIAFKNKERINCDYEKAQLRDAITEMKLATKTFLKGSYIVSMRVNRPYYRNQNKTTI